MRQTEGEQCRLQGLLQHLTVMAIKNADSQDRVTEVLGHLGLNFNNKLLLKLPAHIKTKSQKYTF